MFYSPALIVLKLQSINAFSSFSFKISPPKGNFMNFLFDCFNFDILISGLLSLVEDGTTVLLVLGD